MRPIPLFLDPDPDPELAVNRCVLATGTHLATLETVLLTDRLVEVVLQPRHQQLAGLPSTVNRLRTRFHPKRPCSSATISVACRWGAPSS